MFTPLPLQEKLILFNQFRLRLLQPEIPAYPVLAVHVFNLKQPILSRRVVPLNFKPGATKSFKKYSSRYKRTISSSYGHETPPNFFYRLKQGFKRQPPVAHASNKQALVAVFFERHRLTQIFTPRIDSTIRDLLQTGARTSVPDLLRSSQLLIQGLLNTMLQATSAKVIYHNYAASFATGPTWTAAKSFLRKHPYLKRTRVALVLYHAVLVMLKNKDPKPFSLCLKEIFEKVHYTQHKTYFSLLDTVVADLFPHFKEVFSVLGLKFCLAGKLGVGGSVKKRKQYFMVGKRTNTSKYVRREDIKGFVRTRTGVFGYFISVYY